MQVREYLANQIQEATRVQEAFFGDHCEDLEIVAQWMGDCLSKGGKFLICGNGGSAADAQHFAGELVGRFLKERAALPAIALTTDTSILTAVGNDYGYEQVFSRQVEGLGQPGDILFAISTSGNSPNVLRAVEAARTRSLKTVGFTGNTGGELGKIVDKNLNVRLGETSPRIQEVHIMIVHLLVSMLDEFYLPKGQM